MSRTLNTCLLAGGAVAVLAQLAGAPAYAQADDTAETARTLDTVVVLGERFGEGDTRASFTLGQDDIERLPLGSDVTLSLARVPGLQVSTGDTRGGSFSYEIYLRGLSDEQIGLTVDGVPTGDSRFNGGQPPVRFLESSNVRRIKVSQSAGDIGSPSRFALGGFIDFVTEDPKEEFGAELEAGLGDFDFQRFFGRVDFGEVLPGVTAYASVSTQENAIHTGEQSRKAARDHFEFKALADWGATRLTFRTSYNERDDNDFNIVSLAEFNADPHSDRARDRLTGIPGIDVDFGGALGGTREDLLVYLKGEFDLTDQFALTATPYYHSLNGESFRYQASQSDIEGADPRAVTGYDENGGAIRPPVTELEDPDTFGGPADMRITPRDRERYGLTAEARYIDFLGNQDLRFGLWYETNEANEFRNFYPIAASRIGISVAGQPLQYVEYERFSDIDTLQLFAQDTIRLTDRLTADLGVVWTDISYTARSPLEYSAVLDQSQDSGLNPKLGLTYDLANNWEVFAGYAQNFAGLPEDTFLGSSAAINIEDLDPIETDNVDLGLRYIGDNSAFSAQVYYVDLKDNVGIIPRDPADPADVDDIIRGNVATKAGNVGGIETTGLELTGFKDFGTVDLYGAYSWQDATHEDTSDPVEMANLAAQGVIPGERVRDIPEHSIFAVLGWEPNDQFRLETTVNYIGERTGGHIIVPDFCNPFFCFDEAGNGVEALQALGTDELEAYTLVGLSARYTVENDTALDGLTFQLNVDNLFDETYVSAVSGATATLPEFGVVGGAGRTLDRYFIGAPRTVTFSVRAEF